VTSSSATPPTPPTTADDTADTATPPTPPTPATPARTVTAVDFSPETKGKLLIGVGAFLAAAGIGFAVLGAMALAKHRRINKQRAQRLAVSPSFGRGSAGLAVSGRF
jgi:cell division septation protein DedD